MIIDIAILNFLKMEMQTPAVYGWYHLLWLVLVVGLSVLLCARFRECGRDAVGRTVVAVGVAVAVLEVYKQIVFTFSVSGNVIVADYRWNIFPWQFCSTPMYACLLTGIVRRERVREALYAYLASYALFAGLCVMIYPGDVFVSLIGVNIQTMICHGSMVVIGVWLLATGVVKPELRTLGKGACVFIVAMVIAVLLNEVAWYANWSDGETFNMFFINRHFDSTLPVYKEFQRIFSFPVCLLLYFGIFTLAAGAVLLAAAGIRSACEKNCSRNDLQKMT